MAASYCKRICKLILGLFLYGLGTHLSIQGNVGLAPWDAFSMGISLRTGMSYGTAAILTGVVILAVDLLMGEKIGLGTILNTLLIGSFVDLIAWTGLVPRMTRFLPGVLLLVLGQVILCIGSYYYIGAGLGCGPRDALMIALGKRLKQAPIGLVRGLLEGSVLVIGFLLGAKVGVGTVIAVFGIGFILEWTFRLFRFDVKALEHESILYTCRVWFGKGKGKEQEQEQQ